MAEASPPLDQELEVGSGVGVGGKRTLVTQAGGPALGTS